MSDTLHILVVDDSAMVRQVMTEFLSREPGITVAVAADPFIAMEKMRHTRPDVILLDLELPRMDGLVFLQKIMDEDPIPVVVCSALNDAVAEPALRALQAGAIEVVAKPQFGVRGFLEESSAKILSAIQSAAIAKVQIRSTPRVTRDPVVRVARRTPLREVPRKLVAIGASTGGPPAIEALLAELPIDDIAVVIVQHMAAAYTGAFARRLATRFQLEVREAQDQDAVLAGRVLIAPGGHHMRVRRRGLGYAVEILRGPLVSGHCPSVDVLFHSVASAAAADAVGVIMTGMGTDGAEGLAAMRHAGAATLAQDEASSVVYGMPRAAVAREAVDEVVGLSRLAHAIVARTGSNHARRTGD